MKLKKLIALLSVFIASLSLMGCSKEENNRVDDLINKMTLKEKVTQMLMVDFRYWDENPNDEVEKKEFTTMNSQIQRIVEDYKFGAIIYFAQNIQETEQSLKLSKALQQAATKNNGIPLLISADQEGGSVYRLGSGTALPGNMAIGATNDKNNARIAGEIIGSELQAVGINTNLAPVIDVNNNANNPVIGLRSFSDEAEIVGSMATEMINGFKKHNVIGCAKHFPGHGDTAVDSHYGLPVVSKPKAELMQNELLPFRVAIENEIEMIMTAHILYPGLDDTSVLSNKTKNLEKLPATLSHKIITDLLKNEMKFNGVVTTDAMNMAGIAKIFDEEEAVKLAIKAGVDMICMPTALASNNDLDKLDKIIASVIEAVKTNEIDEARINDACRRILNLKEKRGILDYNAANYTVEKANATVGSKENRALERELASKAVTVIKNKNNTLPLKINSESRVLMMTPFNNERSQMIMGWNRAKKAGLIPSGAEVDVVRFDSESSVTSLKDKLDKSNVIILNSEISKASRLVYANSWLSSKVNDFVNYAKSNNKKAIVMSVDKPYDIQLYSNADAILAVYGCKGSSVDVTEALTGGITASKAAYGPNIIAGIEVLLGVYKASGKLPVSIPKFDATTLSFTEEILYERGYGLTYDSLIK